MARIARLLKRNKGNGRRKKVTKREKKIKNNKSVGEGTDGNETGETYIHTPMEVPMKGRLQISEFDRGLPAAPHIRRNVEHPFTICGCRGSVNKGCVQRKAKAAL